MKTTSFFAERNCFSRTNLCTCSAVNALFIADLTALHGAVMQAFITANALVHINFNTINRKPVKEGINGSQGAEETAEGAID